MMGSSMAREEEALLSLDVRLLAARAAGSGAAGEEKAARFEECIRILEAEKAKMEVFRREFPISVHLVADVIEWLKDELEQRRRHPATASPPPPPAAKRKEEVVTAEEDSNDKRSWMSSAQLWSCGSHPSTSNSNGGGARKHARKVSNAFMPLVASPTFVKSSEKAEAAATVTPLPVPDLSLSSPAAPDAPCPCPAAPSAASSAVTDAGAAGAQRHHQPVQRKARRCWSPELHRRFVAALQRLGGPQAATPKQIRELMNVDGLTNDEVKSHLQKYRLHTRRSSDGSDQQEAAPEQQYTTSEHSTSQSGSPQGPLQLTVSVTAGDSCDGEEEEESYSYSYSYSWEVQQHGAKASSS
ncbi:hypothetical protein GUJ93_ZPchr0012g19115 [Zizania palustris]|uniref:HTH myb-type domain-containing protein n=1 Tax=Zizania palustris TaxID=103762 RepID=A0A8J5WQD8_ZIZPA|nr:hypothetical protein GUJ93_ZPchr0012g19115 [Zizania palustris]